MTPAELAEVTFVQLDITDLERLQALVEQPQVTHIIHLA
jgi:UDP-glucose 4-epimerase